jgi:hypothetical protein
MRRPVFLLLVLCAAVGLAVAQMGKPGGAASGRPDFQITASYIEACSCTMFCPCYFNTQPTEHHTQHGSKHFCEANLVMKVDKGHYKNVKLDGVKVWIGTDLGHDFSGGKGDWLALTFDTAVSEAQRAAMMDILTQLYPMQFKLLGADAAAIEWNVDEAKGVAIARLADGKGEVILDRWKGADPKKESVLHNVKYWAAQSNNGFRMWKSRQVSYNNHGKQFAHKGTNGFLITIDFHGQAKQAAAD